MLRYRTSSLRFTTAVLAAGFLNLFGAVAHAKPVPACHRVGGNWATPSMWQAIMALLRSGSDQDSGQTTAPSANRRDPTDPQGELKRLLDAKSNGTPSEARPVAGPRIPQLGLQGRIIGGTSEPSALLMVEKGVYVVVRAGREYLISAGGQPVTFYVQSIRVDGVELEFRPSGQRLVLP